jgi:hypothetical protein
MDSDVLIMTGGVHVQRGNPVADVYKINVTNAPSVLEQLNEMHNQRFGHCSVDIKGTLYVFGGFCHMESS